MRHTTTTWPDGTPRSQRNAFDRAHYVGRIDWTGGAKAAATKIKAAKELVEGQAHELTAVPAKKGAMSAGYYQIGTRRGDVGRKRMKATE